MATTEIEVWVLVDEGGDYVVRKASDELAETYADEIGGEDVALRRICIKVTVPLPCPVVLSGVVGAEPTDGKLEVTG